MHSDDLAVLAITIARLLGTAIDDEQLECLTGAVKDVGLHNVHDLQNRLDSYLATKGRNWGDQAQVAAEQMARLQDNPCDHVGFTNPMDVCDRCGTDLDPLVA